MNSDHVEYEYGLLFYWAACGTKGREREEEEEEKKERSWKSWTEDETTETIPELFK